MRRKKLVVPADLQAELIATMRGAFALADEMREMSVEEFAAQKADAAMRHKIRKSKRVSDDVLLREERNIREELRVAGTEHDDGSIYARIADECGYSPLTVRDRFLAMKRRARGR